MLKKNNLNTEIKRVAELVNIELDRVLCKTHINSDDLLNAMRYIVLNPGKRLRPFLIYASCAIFGLKDVKYWLNTAVAVELIHNYSLIHDDLPSIDNDDFRRGKLSCHKKYNEATAILAGDALLTYAFEILLSDTSCEDSLVNNELILMVARTIGYQGMIGGQSLDINSKFKDDIALTHNEMINIMRMKTGYLFAASCEAAAIISKQQKIYRKALREYGENIGIAYQIKDDIDDQDNPKNNANKKYLKQYIDNALKCLLVFNEDADILRDFAKLLY